ncbi:hypothetical protein [Dactylosporangium matsuzakiense]|uniref:DUF3558 domain-containing protein n=1 Tax=Dactylosporangium matsuzakiense TaxID=53360 RepID=A0A9W6NRX6_9ACTN|nr:hypothetical protein [Dactylosporangium matsuzakiense]UWZ46468.1 hypothetical protein Dmats_08605 [Dactylosporangium matsuzakiense]GLL06597.1 hypothetical protein GCM10017581_083470 [Dactylosporangium matsuzakiense]
MRYTLLAVFAGAAATLAACSGGSPQAPSTPYVPTPDQTTLLPQTGPAPLKPGASAQAGCPVDNATLEKALAADPAIAAAVQLGKGLTDISCAADFATAHTEGDRATVLFRFDGAQKMWVAVSGAAKNSCESVPTDVRKQLKNCA